MALSKNIATYYQGEWRKENTAIIHAADQAAWLGSQIFDGARRFEGVTPDLDLHCARMIRSAHALALEPEITAPEIQAIIEEGIKLFNPQSALYLRPMMWAVENGAGIIDYQPNSVGFAICIEELPMPTLGQYSLTVAPYRRPSPETALTEAKSAALYANNARIVRFAQSKGYSNALSLDLQDRVAETASTNVFMVRDGVVFTPRPTGCFLAGITRSRVIDLLRQDGIEVIENDLTLKDFDQAEEIFVTGNIAKVMPVARYQEKTFEQTKLALHAHSLYRDYALSSK